MTDKEDIIAKNGIENILKQKGYSKNSDFIFVGYDSETDFSYDGVPKYRIANYGRNETSFYSEEFKKDITLDVIDPLFMEPGGQTSGNNSTYAVYVPKQGFVFTQNPEIKNLMEKEFGYKDTHFGIPLSNGGQFHDKKLQNIWKTIVLNQKTKDLKLKQEKTTTNLEQNAVQVLNNQVRE